jgi:outer membrane receptor protein involved in Fe transport
VYTNVSAFAQDTWRVNPRLTLTYGVRYELNPSPEEANGKQPLTVTGLDDLSTLALAPQGTPFYETTYGNLAPRVGVAYALTSDSRTVVRGGAGIFYDLGSAFTGSAYSTTVYPFAQIIPTVNVPLSSPIFANPAPPVSIVPPYGRLFAFPDFRLPYTVEYNATIEHRLGASSLVSVG